MSPATAFKLATRHQMAFVTLALAWTSEVS